MQRDLPTILGGLFLLVIVAIIMYSNNGNKGLSLSDSNSIPTSGILGVTTTPSEEVQDPNAPTIPLVTITPSLSMTPTVTPSKTPSPTPPTPRVTNSATPSLDKPISCASVESKARVTATMFKTKHIAKDYTVLSLISSPSTQDDTDQLDYWLGTDTDAPRLYATTPTTYATLKFEPEGSLKDRGDDQDNRGSKRCQLTINERRKITNQDGTTTEENVTRYLDFAVDESEDIILTGFKDGREGKKYSGFN